MYQRKEPKGPGCVHNDGVACTLKRKICHRCGWNPEVAKRRKERYCGGKSKVPAVGHSV